MIGLVLKDNVLSTIIHGYFVCTVQIKPLCTLLDAFIGISAVRMFLQENGIAKQLQRFSIARRMKS